MDVDVAEQAAEGRHHHLYRDVAAGPGTRCGQPRPGFPRLRGTRAPGRGTRPGDARRPQPVRADDRGARAAPGHRRQDPSRVRPPARRGRRGHGDQRRHRSHLQRHPRGGAGRRRSGGARPLLRLLRTGDRPGRRPRRARAAGPGDLRPRLAAGARGDRAAHAHADDQQPAQPLRRHAVGAGHGRAGRDPRGHRHLPALGRGLRAHRVRRRPPRVRAALAGAARSRLRGVELRQDLPLHRLEGRLLHRPAGADRRVPQGPPVQRVLHLRPGPARLRRDAGGRAGALRAAGRLLPGQARPLPRAAGDHPTAAAAGARRLLPAGGLFGRQRPRRRRVLPMADGGTRRGRYPPFAVLRGAATGPAAGPPVLRQEPGDAGRGDWAPAAAVPAPRGPAYPSPRGLDRLAA